MTFSNSSESSGVTELSSEYDTNQTAKPRCWPWISLEGEPREQKMLKEHLPRVIYHQVYYQTKINSLKPFKLFPLGAAAA